MIVYKFLDTAAHVESFLAGNIRFTCLEEYQLTEDEVRRDLNEGNVIFNMPPAPNLLPSAHAVTYLPIRDEEVILRPKDWYVLCFSLNHELPHFAGKYCVQINDIDALIERCKLKIALIPDAEFSHDKVHYYDAKSLKQVLKACSGERPFVKTQSYANECEYRLAFRAQNRVEFAIGPQQNYVHVVSHARIFNLKVGTLKDIASLITTPTSSYS